MFKLLICLIVKMVLKWCQGNTFRIGIVFPWRYNTKLWGRSLTTKWFGLHSNSRGTYEINGLPSSIDFRNRNTELLLVLFPWYFKRDFHAFYVTANQVNEITFATHNIDLMIIDGLCKWSRNIWPVI